MFKVATSTIYYYVLFGIDGIVGRPPNEVNYSTLNRRIMKTGKPTENRIPRKHKKYGISGNIAKYIKKEEIAGKNGYLIGPGDEKDRHDEGCRIGWRRGWRHKSVKTDEL